MKRGQFNKLYPTHHDFGAHRKPYGMSSFNRLVRQYKANAKARELDYELEDWQVAAITSATCVYCGTPPSNVMRESTAHGEYLYNGIDRQDPTVGYVYDNCVACCYICNRAKSNMSLEAWNAWLERIRGHGDRSHG